MVPLKKISMHANKTENSIFMKGIEVT